MSLQSIKQIMNTFKYSNRIDQPSQLAVFKYVYLNQLIYNSYSNTCQISNT